MGYCDSSNCNHPVLVIGRVGALCGNVHLITPPAWITDNALVMPTDAATFSQKYLAAVLRTRNLMSWRTKQPSPSSLEHASETSEFPYHPSPNKLPSPRIWTWRRRSWTRWCLRWRRRWSGCRNTAPPSSPPPSPARSTSGGRHQFTLKIMIQQMRLSYELVVVHGRKWSRP